MRSDGKFTGECIAELREEIRAAGGNEVFAQGWIGEKGLVERIKVLARGNEGAVLAIRGRPGGGEDLSGKETCVKETRVNETCDVLIHNHPSGYLVPSDNDLRIAGRAAEEGVGSYIIDNDAEKVYVVAESARRRKPRALKADRICAALEQGGSIAERLPSWEPRASQLDLMRLIIRGFNEDALVAAEAGTGVGKSFAYLLPAVHYALDNDERIVVSTATINLQQQLFDKDIPLVSLSTGRKIKAVLIKGRGNYLCLRRLADAAKEPELNDENNGELQKIADWSLTTKTGGRSDLSFSPAETLWSRVCSEADLCMGMRCPCREKCFVFSLRKEAADARLLVVNHHLLFADLAARREGAGYEGTVVLPPYTRVIIDEAHTIEDAATSFFSKEFSRLGIFRQLGRLYRRRRANQRGLLVRLASMAGRDPARDRLDEAAAAVEKVRDAADSLDEAGLLLCGDEGIFRLTPAKEETVKPFFTLFAVLRKHISALGDLVRNLLEEFDDQDKGLKDGGLESCIWEIKTVLRRLDDVGGICSSFINYREKPDEVMWMEQRRANAGDPWVAYSVTPVDVAPALEEALWKPNKSVICTSATLAVGGGSFDYWAGRSGLRLLKDRRFLSGCFPSPFPYAASVLLAVPEDAPLPEEESYRSFVDRAVPRLIAAAGGSALALFTSYQALKSAYNAALPELRGLGIRCLKQGDDDRSRLLSAFLEDKTSVLFATDSFWQGVDAPGDALRLVILCRLPFRTPNDPVFEARREALEKKGMSAFMELSLPESVMKFKQGFGRLMRRSSDHGVVAVLDGRIIKKRYGEFFIRSLPETKKCFGEFETIVRKAESFLYARLAK
ncbi:MAG: ATP-dependent DNA helicase DinG [Treponema sp.]|nr:ATP-dependent DNA helicase DinG [Treponema sp.]